MPHERRFATIPLRMECDQGAGESDLLKHTA
jgi:hypothetical protein